MSNALVNVFKIVIIVAIIMASIVAYNFVDRLINSSRMSFGLEPREPFTSLNASVPLNHAAYSFKEVEYEIIEFEPLYFTVGEELD